MDAKTVLISFVLPAVLALFGTPLVTLIKGVWNNKATQGNTLVTTTTGVVDMLNKQLDRMQKQLDDLQTKYDETRDELRQVRDERDDLRGRVDDLERQVKKEETI